MGKKNKNNSSFFLDLSNNSTADIGLQLSGRYQCSICQSSESPQKLVDICRCLDPVHEQCMIKLIDEWNLNQHQDINQQHKQKEKPYFCKKCKSQVFYQTKNELSCRNLTGILTFLENNPIKAIFEILFFLIGTTGLILTILIKLQKVTFQSEINPLTLSIFSIASIIVSSLTVMISFYFIFVDILTRRRKKVEKIYQKNKSPRKKMSQSIPVIQLR